MIRKRTILGVPASCFWVIIAFCLLGIVIGSFCDLDLSKVIANKTQIGTYFATFSPALAYCLLPAGGSCLFKGLKKKSDSLTPMAWVILLFSCFMAVYYSNEYLGKEYLIIRMQ